MGMEKMFTREVTAIGNALGLEGEFLVEFGFSQIMEKLLPPPPEMETVEVVRWMCVSCDEVYDFRPMTRDCGAKLNEHGGECESTEYVKLSGTFQRPKPVKVERSVSVEATIGESRLQYTSGSCRFAADNGKPALTHHPECHGKTGMLTFTWTE